MRTYRVFGAFFLALLFFFGVGNIHIGIESIKKLIDKDITFSEFTDEIADRYSDDITYRAEYINLNGLAARIAHRRVVNHVTKLLNGALFTPEDYKPVIGNAEKTVLLSEYLNERGIQFAFVQSPDKIDLQNKLLPEGLEDYSNLMADEFTEYLIENGVSVLDLRTLYDYQHDYFESFYKTDHHWTTKGAFKGFVRISEYLAKHFPSESIDEKCLDMSNYNTTTFERSFLGSSGKRTGIYYTGVDDFDLICPAFPTDITTVIDKRQLARRGDFSTVNIMYERFDQGYDYFNNNAYAGYIGNDYPVVTHYNHLAQNNLKVAILKDSFVLPVQAFLSTICA